MSGQFRIVNKSLACSSLVFGWFQFYGEKITPEVFAKFALKAAHSAEHETETDGDGDEAAVLSGYGVKDFAFVTASTDQDQPQIEEMLRFFGFVGTERTKKNKNPKTECIFWVAQAVPFFDKCREYDPAGWEKLGINVAKNEWD